MDRSDKIVLVSVITSQDTIGQVTTTTKEKSVFCNVQSISQNEFFQASKNGLNPSYKVSMFRYDYSGEKIAKYNNTEYGIYRTYIGRNDTIELYLEEKQGITYD